MDRAREAETEGQKERLRAEWMERMIQQRYRKREKRGNVCREWADCEEDH